MPRLLRWTLLLIALLVLHARAAPAPNFQDLFGYFRRGTARPSSSSSSGRKGRSRYDELCRVHNPNPFAFPGAAPYPAQPLCSYG